MTVLYPMTRYPFGWFAINEIQEGLLEIMTDEEFICELCVNDGKPQYMLPARRSVYGRLAELDPIYDQLYKLLLPEENGVFRYGKTFYEEFYRKSDDILESLMTTDKGSDPGSKT